MKKLLPEIIILIAIIVIITATEPLLVKHFFNFKANKGSSSLTVITKSVGKVYLSQKYYGQTPITIKNISSGVHNLKITFPNSNNFYSTFEQSIPFERGNTTVVKWSEGPSYTFSSGAIYYFKRNFQNNAGLDININAKSEIFINGKFVKTSKSLSEVLPSGSYNITMLSPGFTKKTIEVNLKNGYNIYTNVKLFEIPIK
ncbi:PEGA domain-containing protein [Patescibacteria group bacterium]|nr:PEGA domain-containing protein [Patescibacteria group bacterium]